ncbi:hypothetical protein [Novosphingobium sp.]|uniref:hypothetical protein n=1 Tax=Novosphingobium sp. TaxID=1874826 RepID=UPI00286D3549|nr:hypothetical protein [Novosphingobium sp.]
MSEREATPEAHNQSQDDDADQAQTLADEALGRATTFDDEESEKVGSGDESEGSTPDLVDTMNQMVSSGHIDMGAFAGERNDDDEEQTYGKDADAEDDFPHGAE